VASQSHPKPRTCHAPRLPVSFALCVFKVTMSAFIDLVRDEEPFANAVLMYIYNSIKGFGKDSEWFADCIEVDPAEYCVKIGGKVAVRVGSKQDYHVNFGPGLAVGMSNFTDIMSVCCQNKLVDLTKDDGNCRETDELQMFQGSVKFDCSRFLIDEEFNVLIVSFEDDGDDQRFPGEGDKVYVQARDFVYRVVMFLALKHVEDLRDPMLQY